MAQMVAQPDVIDEVWDVEPETDDTDTYVLPAEHAEPFGLAPLKSTWDTWVQNGGDPQLYPYSPEEYGTLEHWWLAELATYPTADLEAELEHVTRQLVDHSLLTDDVLRMIGAVYDEPILQARAKWLAWEMKRREALPEPPRAGARIPSELVARLKDSLDLGQFLISRLGFDLKQRGRDWWGPCPFHIEQTPSFVVHANGKWHCFGACNQSGDVFDILLTSGECRTWRQAVEYVADYLHVAMPKPPEPRPPAVPRPLPPMTTVQSVAIPTL